MRKRYLYAAWLIMLITLAGCATMHEVDLSRTTEKVPVDVIEEPEPVRTVYEERVIYIEKPVYLPWPGYSKTENRVQDQRLEPDRATGRLEDKGAVKQSVEDASRQPEYWQGGMIIYDYDNTFSYNIYTQPLRITDVQLEPGEVVTGQPVTGDTTRWILGSGVSYVDGIETQHIYLKPVKEGLQTSLIINTNRRRYYLILYSFADVFMMGVCWNYPRQSLPRQYVKLQPNTPGAGQGINPETLCFNYTLNYTGAQPPAWLPERVFDDGAKTYITLPESVLTGDLPAVFMDNGDIVNFRITRRTIVLDRLVTGLNLKLDDVSVSVKKKGQIMSETDGIMEGFSGGQPEDTVVDQPVDKVEGDELHNIQSAANTNIPRLNKKIVMAVVIGLIVLLLAGFVLAGFSKKSRKPQAEKKQTNVTVPKFDPRLMEAKAEGQIPDPVLPVEADNPYAKEKAENPQGGITTAVKNTTTARTTAVQPDRASRDTTKQRLLAEDEAARRAGITVALNSRGGAETGEPQDPLTAFRGSGQYAELFRQAGSNPAAGSQPAAQDGGEGSRYADYAAANMQDQKQEFFTAGKSASGLLTAAEPAVNLSNLVAEGTVIPAVLITAINSDLPGNVDAMVTQNIYSFDGAWILIPQGSKLRANYNANVSWRQKRIQIAWNRLIRPDGVSLDLGNMPGIDARGAAGSPGAVDNHLLETAGSLGVLAAFTLLTTEIEFHAANLSSPGLINVAGATGSQAEDYAAGIVQRALDIQPTIHVPAGRTIYVSVNTDLALPVYQI